MKKKRYGGLSDPIEVEEETIDKPVEINDATEIKDGIEVEEAIEPTKPIEIEVTSNPVQFDEEKESDGTGEAMEETHNIKILVLEEPDEEIFEPKSIPLQPIIDPKPVDTAPTTAKVRILAQTLNVRSGPGFGFTAVDFSKNGFIHELLEEKDGWGKIGDNRWITLDERLVERI